MTACSRIRTFVLPWLFAAALCVMLAGAMPALAVGQSQDIGESGIGSLTLATEIGEAAIDSCLTAAEDYSADVVKKAREKAHRAAVKKKALARALEEGSATDWCIAVDIEAKRTVVMQWQGKAWKVVKYWICSTGAPESPTLTGVYEVGDRGYAFGDGYTCYYYTQYCGNYLFHSIKYEPGTFDVQDGRLGEDVSEGCVRLKLENARWIYDTIPSGSRVIVYE